MVRIVAFIIALLATSPLYAVNSHCVSSYPVHNSYVAHDYVSHDYVQPQTIIENQNVFYSVASDLRQYAVTPQAVRVAEYGQFQRQIQRLADQLAEAKEQAAYAPQQVMCVPMYCAPGQQPPAVQPPAQQPAAQPQTPPAPQNPTFSMRQGGVIQAKCIKCHGGSGQPKGELDLRDKISCKQFHAAIDRLLTDDVSQRMPLKQPALSGEETAAAMKELTAMVAAEK